MNFKKEPTFTVFAQHNAIQPYLISAFMYVFVTPWSITLSSPLSVFSSHENARIPFCKVLLAFISLLVLSTILM